MTGRLPVTVSSVQTWFYMKAYVQKSSPGSTQLPTSRHLLSPLELPAWHLIIVCGAPRAYGLAGQFYYSPAAPNAFEEANKACKRVKDTRDAVKKCFGEAVSKWKAAVRASELKWNLVSPCAPVTRSWLSPETLHFRRALACCLVPIRCPLVQWMSNDGCALATSATLSFFNHKKHAWLVQRRMHQCLCTCFGMGEEFFETSFFRLVGLLRTYLTVINLIPTRPRFCGHVAGVCSRGDNIEACWLVSRRDPSRCGLPQY